MTQFTFVRAILSFGLGLLLQYISFIFILDEKWGIHIWNKIGKVIKDFSFRPRLSKYRRTERKIVNCGWSILYTGIEIYFNKKKNRSLIISVGLVKCKQMIEYKRIFLNIISNNLGSDSTYISYKSYNFVRFYILSYILIDFPILPIFYQKSRTFLWICQFYSV